MKQPKSYPIGIQTFSEVISKNYLYVDKTEYVWRLAHGASKYVFLSRPRRFGKSLLTSTLYSFFEGKKELFLGLSIDRLETEWISYPVLYFDMSTAKHLNEVSLLQEIEGKLSMYEKIYGREDFHINVNQRLEGLIRHAYEKTGKQVVVLIDEYDAPLLDVVHEDVNLPQLRQIMRNFYSPLKSCDPYLRFVFFTGITKFSQLSIFSELNNMQNISMEDKYAAICGITEDEIHSYMDDSVRNLASELNVSEDEVYDKLKLYYDGYHFTADSPDLYNPFSLMNALERGRIGNYWFESGTPTYLIEMIRKFDVLPSEIGGVSVMASHFDAPTENLTSIIPLLYQSGYLTIKKYSQLTDFYTLDFPNLEVKSGLMESLLPFYVNGKNIAGMNIVGLMYEAIYNQKIDDALSYLKTFLSTIPYCDNTDYEGHYQQMLYVIFSLFGYYVDVEVRTPSGRVDLVMRTKTNIYVIELKLSGTAEEALNQIKLKNYPERFVMCGLPIVKVGIGFDMKKHTLKEWKISMD